LEDLEDFIAVNHRNYKQYERELADIPGIRLSSYDESEKRNYQYVVLDIDEEAAHLGRDALQKVLWAENVLARRYFYPGCHRMEPYRSCFPYAGERLPNTERLSRRVLSLPTGTGITADQIAEICRIIRLAAAHGPEVREKLKRSNPTELPNP
jgi:dTDP-4-amino-4,6-dideoxygalactose transaminase